MLFQGGRIFFSLNLIDELLLLTLLLFFSLSLSLFLFLFFSSFSPKIPSFILSPLSLSLLFPSPFSLQLLIKTTGDSIGMLDQMSTSSSTTVTGALTYNAQMKTEKNVHSLLHLCFPDDDLRMQWFVFFLCVFFSERKRGAREGRGKEYGNMGNSS